MRLLPAVLLLSTLLPRMAAAQIITTVAGGGPLEGPARAARLEQVTAVTTDGAGNLLVAIRDRVFRVDHATGLLTPFAGSGAIVPPGGDGGPALLATFDYIWALAVSPGGDVFIATPFRIRKVDGGSGFISTVAGNGGTNYGGDGGPATSASFAYATGLALDAVGNIYVADRDANRIRRVDAATQVITTVAGYGTAAYWGDGGLATSAALKYPNHVSVDPSGHLLIADWGNRRIRRVDAATGIITTIGGNGACDPLNDGALATSAAVCDQLGLSVGPAGDVFIVDGLRLRRIDGTTGIITTVAGDGTRGTNGEGGPASGARLSAPHAVHVDAGGDVYIGDAGGVRRIDGSTAVIATVVGGGDGMLATAVRLLSPYGLAMGAHGDLFMADTWDQRVRRIDLATGLISTICGDGIAGFSGDGGPALQARVNWPGALAVDATGNLYVVDGSNFRVRRIDAVSGLITTVAGSGYTIYDGDGGPATSAGLTPGGVAISADGDLYVADYANHRIRRVDGDTGIITTVAGTGAAGFSGDGGLATAAALRSPGAVAFAPGGHLYVADSQNHRVRRIDAVTGVITTIAGDGTIDAGADGVPATSSGLPWPQTVAFDAAGHLLIGDASFRVRVVDGATGLITTLAGTGHSGFSGDGGPALAAEMWAPRTLAVNGEYVYVADADNRCVRRVGPSGIAPLTWTAPAAGGSFDVTVGQSGAGNWTAVSDADWLTVSVDAGTAAGTTALTAAPNPSASPRLAVVTIAGQRVAVTQLMDYPRLTVDRTALAFGAVRSGASFTTTTAAQVIRLRERGAAPFAWAVTSSSPWLQVTPTSGNASADLVVTVVYAPGVPTSGTLDGSLTITATGAVGVAPIAVRLSVTSTAAAGRAFGTIDTPLDNATNVFGAVAFTGWALDDLEVTGVVVCRAPVTGETAPLDARCGNTRKIYVGDAVFIDGARPDVEVAYPAHPLRTRAGWGLMVLTNMLPDVSRRTVAGGNGRFTFTFYAFDRDGHTTVLGTRTITCNNAAATLPFGTIDTPAQGAVVSGAMYANFGWALVPQPRGIPPSTGSVAVFIDGQRVGYADYGYGRADIQALFPGLSNTNGAVGVRVIDTTLITNGLHTISWSVCDDANNCAGIGSRFFTVSNGVLDRAPRLTEATAASAPAAHVRALPADIWAVSGRRGWDPDAAFAPGTVTAAGTTLLDGEEVDRLELDLALEPRETVIGYLRVGTELRPLPVGATLDARTGRFTWAPGAGFVGRYDLVFVRSVDGHAVGRREVRVRIAPKRSVAR